MQNSKRKTERSRFIKKQSALVVLSFTFCVLNLRCQAAADVYLGLQANGGNGKALGVGLANFSSTSSDSEIQTLATSLRSVLRADFLFEGLFNVTEGGPVPTDKLDSLAWSGQGAQVVIAGNVTGQTDKVTLELKIFDVGSGKVLYAKMGTGPKSGYRRLAHLLADQVTFQLSGQPGIAHTRIAFVNNHTAHKEVYVMDYDGANVRQLTAHRSIDLLPKWTPDGKQMLFNSYRGGNPDAYVMNADGSGLRELSARQGLNTAAAWSPDGTQVAVTLSRGGDPELYLLDINGKILRRLTFSPGVDTSPAFSPNGQQIVFVSDRAGNPELYVMDTTGANVQRLTYGQWVDAPAWSPKGDLIIYERQRSDSRFDIWAIDPAGRNNTQISESGSRNENPSWSPDGRFIAYSSNRDGRYKICIMGSDGSNPHCLGDVAGESTTPSWGP